MMVPFSIGGVAAKLNRFLGTLLQAGKALFTTMLPYRSLVQFTGIVNQADVLDGADAETDLAPVACLR
jgi:hypothetical protein